MVTTLPDDDEVVVEIEEEVSGDALVEDNGIDEENGAELFEERVAVLVEEMELADERDGDGCVDEVEAMLFLVEEVMEDVRVPLEVAVLIKAEVEIVELLELVAVEENLDAVDERVIADVADVADPLEEVENKIEAVETIDDVFEDEVEVLVASVDEEEIDEPLKDELD